MQKEKVIEVRILNHAIGAYMRSILVHNGTRQCIAAKELGMTQSSLSRTIQGLRDTTFVEVLEFCERFGIDYRTFEQSVRAIAKDPTYRSHLLESWSINAGKRACQARVCSAMNHAVRVLQVGAPPAGEYK